jgi:hypothetical protein
MATSDLNRVGFLGADFATSLDEVLARLQVKFASSYNDFTASSLGIVILDAVAFAMDTMSFYLDRRASDNYLTTGRTRNAVSKLSRQLGHKMAAAVASGVDIEVSPKVSHAFPITIPIGFQFQGPGGLIFETKEAVTWNASETMTKTITCAEGETKTVSFVSTGSANQVFQIRNVPKNKFIVGAGTDGVSQLTVVVNGAQWEEEELLQFESTNQFEVGYNDDPPTLRFGDGIAGNIPEEGTSIVLTYFASSGVAGKANSNTITSSVKPLVVSFTVIDLNINNPDVTNGGADPETIQKAKAYAPKLFAARGVNVTRDDYEARAATFVDSVYGTVAVAQAVTVRSISSDVYLAGKVSAINNLVSEINADVVSVIDSVKTTLTTAGTENTSVQTDGTSIQSSLDDITTANDSLISLHNDAKTNANIASDEVVDIITQGTTIKNTVDAITTDVADKLTTATKLILQNAINLILAKANDASSKTSSVYTSLASTAVVNTQAIALGVDEITDIATSIGIHTANVATDITSATTVLTNLEAGLDDIESGVQTATDDILEHVSSFVSSDCQSNLIEVPILTLDSDGFYAVPTIGLQRSLQKYLDSKKEVTQVVKVVGASDVLIPADISVRIGIKTGYVESTIRSRVESLILSVLKGRSFGATLFLFDLYSPIKQAAIEGLAYINIAITSPEIKLDVDGNLLVNKYEVITRGTITMTTEFQASTN